MSQSKLRHQFKSIYKQFIFNLCANRHPLYTGFYKYLYKPKKGTLAYIIDKYSRNTPNLTVIQVGANDGFNHDPIVKFIKRDNWHGVLLEPQKYVHDTFLSKMHATDNNMHTINAALDYEDGERSIYNIAFSKARWATGLSSLNKSVIEESISNGHIAMRALKEGVALPKHLKDYISEEKIIAISPKTLLNQYQINKIDLLQIDAEGFDYEIIKMLDIEKTQPGMIIFEDSHLDDVTLHECHDLLFKQAYTLRKTQGNTVAIKNHLLQKIS
jgi:FkbM family methyltransferase